MARPLRVEFPGAIYHVTCRMIGDDRPNQSLLFVDSADRKRFLDQLAYRVEQYNIRLYLFVCMTTHFHLVFETPEGNCSKFMQSLTTAYSVYYNPRHSRHGHLFDGRYKAKLVDSDNYLLALTRYVHLNPVQIDSIKNKPIKDKIRCLRQYPWSSYLSYIGERKVLDFIEYGPILAEVTDQQSSGRSDRQGAYREFVEAGLARDDDDFRLALQESPRSIGNDSFRSRIDKLYEDLIEGHSRPEDISFRHITEPVPVETIMETLAEMLDVEIETFRQRRRNSPLRAVAARMLMRFGGQDQRQAASHLNMGTGGAVSSQLRKLPEFLERDSDLRRAVEKIHEKLDILRPKSQS